MSERILKLALLVVVALYGVGGGVFDVVLALQLLPEQTVIKRAAVYLAAGVINILNVGKYGNSFQKLNHLGRQTYRSWRQK